MNTCGSRRRSSLTTLALALLVAFFGVIGLAGCGNAGAPYIASGLNGSPADFTIQVTPGSQNEYTGGSKTFTVTLTSLSGFSSPVTLSQSGMPAGSTVAFGSPTVTPTAAGATTTVTLTSPVNLPNGGTYTITVTGTGGGLTHSTTVQLVLQIG